MRVGGTAAACASTHPRHACRPASVRITSIGMSYGCGRIDGIVPLPSPTPIFSGGLSGAAARRFARVRSKKPQPYPRQIGRAHVCTPVTDAHLVCRLLLEKNKSEYTDHTPISLTHNES